MPELRRRIYWIVLIQILRSYSIADTGEGTTNGQLAFWRFMDNMRDAIGNGMRELLLGDATQFKPRIDLSNGYSLCYKSDQ